VAGLPALKREAPVSSGGGGAVQRERRRARHRYV
jgi:hypothetical protein